MNGETWLGSLLGSPPPVAEPTWADVLERVKAEHGRGTTRYLADALGVTIRSAQRWVKGQHAPSRRSVEAALPIYDELRADAQQERDAKHQQDTADFIRLITRLNPGSVKVRPRSGPGRDTFRTIGDLDQMGAGMERVASAWEDGDESGAADALADAILARYAGQDSDETQGLAAILAIVDYPHGIRYG